MYRICGSERGRYAVSTQLPAAEPKDRTNSERLVKSPRHSGRLLNALRRARQRKFMDQRRVFTGRKNTNLEEEKS